MAEKIKTYTFKMNNTIKRFEQYCKEENKIEKRELLKILEDYLDGIGYWWEKKEEKPEDIPDDDLPF